MYKFVRAISLFYIYVFNRVKVTGKENIPTDGALIICANHHSVFDILLLLTVFKRRIIFMAKQELFKIPVMRFFLKRLNAISVDRSGMPISAVRGALKALKNGEQLGIFPEGTRYNSGDGSDARGGRRDFRGQRRRYCQRSGGRRADGRRPGQDQPGHAHLPQVHAHCLPEHRLCAGGQGALPDPDRAGHHQHVVGRLCGCRRHDPGRAERDPDAECERVSVKLQ